MTNEGGPRGVTSRRDFLSDALRVAAVAPAALASTPSTAAPSDGKPSDMGSAVPAITPATIAEAEKLHAVRFTAEQDVELAATMPAQVKNVEALRKVGRSLELQPALHFDPRLPGKHYPQQKNLVRLASAEYPPLPQDDVELAYAPVNHLSHWIHSRQLTSERLTELYLERIARIAPKLYCYITVTSDLARAQAKAMDAELLAGKYRGPLHGVPYSLKDVFDTQGIATTWGCAIYRDRVPEQDATIVKMLRDAGAVLLGKVGMGELANGWEWFGGKCRNPWNPDEPAGGSSSGSGSATAAGLCAFSIGTDSLGSILNPADRCGIVGLRPTFGRVPVKGAMPLTPSLERIGPLCRSVEDAALVLAAINGYDPSSASSIDMGFSYDPSIDLHKLRVGYSPKWFQQIGFNAKVTAAVSSAEQSALKALGELGVRLVPVDLPDLPYGILLENVYVEAGAVFEELTLTGRDLELVNKEGWPQAWRKARLLSAIDYVQIDRFRRQIMQRMFELFETVDVVFGPTYGSFDLFVIMNFTGQPGVTLRAGFAESPTRAMNVAQFFAPADPHSVPHTITRNVAFHGRLFEDGTMLALAHALESKLGVSRRHPIIA
jgi:Asp-tRNA(Asn)/Glu-tRNA(Gln) amidotransferase A subunit family amidase